jgi:hypothetical protein
MLSRGMPQLAVKWLLLLHQLPSKPAYVRVKLWRRLHGIGAVPIKNAVHILPASEQSREDFEWLRKEILESRGEAVICEARLVDGLTDAGVRGLFDAARDSEYSEIADDIRSLLAKLDGAASADSHDDLKAQFGRLKNRHLQNVAIDFFGATGRETADGLIDALEKAISEDAMEQPDEKNEPHSGIENLRERIWVTRQGVHVDRIACAWMIKRFIDQRAVFKFVLPKIYQHAPGELRFDMFDAEFTHEGDRCSFEVLVKRAGLDDVALVPISEIVHDIDLKDEKFGRDETAGVKALINGICSTTHEDTERIERGSAIFDGLYAVFQRNPRPQEKRKRARIRAQAGVRKAAVKRSQR